jgi:hypothetical protein
MTLEWYFAVVFSHLLIGTVGYVMGKTWLDRRLAKPVPKPPTNGDKTV